MEKTRMLRLPHPDLGLPVDLEAYLPGNQDQLGHSLTLILDEQGVNKTAGTVYLHYCGFQGYDCGCKPDLAAASGIFLGKAPVCIYPLQGFPIVFSVQQLTFHVPR